MPTVPQSNALDQPAGRDAYRAPAPAPRICSVCDEPGFAACPRCGRLFCVNHAMVGRDERCPDCEIALARRSRRGVAVAVVAPLAAVTPIALVWLGVAEGLAALAAIAAGAIGVGAARLVDRWHRRRFLAEGEHPAFLMNTRVPIAPRDPEAERHEQTDLALPRHHVDPPRGPIWHRAFGG